MDTMKAESKVEGQLLPEPKHISGVRADTPLPETPDVVLTRDHEVIKHWAEKRQAMPATGQTTSTGPATVNVNDGGAGIRFNFPGASLFRPITWDEWLENFDEHGCAFVYDNDSAEGTVSNRYRIVRAVDWQDYLE
jgi:hypothetical protein